MTAGDPSDAATSSPKIRWWPAILILLAATVAVVWVRAQTEWAFQKRNLNVGSIILTAILWLLVWWTCFSRARLRLRLGITAGLIALFALGAALFRIRGVSGDLVPILEFRWTQRAPFETPAPTASAIQPLAESTNSFPQFLGPDRNGVLSGRPVDTNWPAHPPTVLWRQKVGAAWSGFAVVGKVCVTQEQRGEDECVVTYELASGRQLWWHADQAHYHTAIAGEGPRSTPTISSNRVFTSGSTGILNCFDLATGRLIWTRNVVADSGGRIPEWGFASSSLLVEDRVIVHGGEGATHSLFAFRADDGQPVWSAGEYQPSYASPSLATLADVPQVLAFNHRRLSAHDPTAGTVLWDRPWGSGNAVCSSPVVAGSNRVVFSSGYGYGAELLQISKDTAGNLSVERLWKSPRMKAKFAHLFVRDGFLYGLDDGVFACVDLKDGSQRWKEGRYGHGQGLLVSDLYLLMAESGELVLLRPTPESPNELARSPVFTAKTWNPIALAADLLLVRNDQEAACLRLKLAP